MPAEASARYRSLLRGVIRQQERARPVRFIDKSQSLTLRVGAVHEALVDSDPRFVLMTRDPYAVIWSQATRDGVVKDLAVPMEKKMKIQLCAEHWKNSFSAALEDAGANPAIKLRHWSFEGLLADPEETVSEICDFADLPWDPLILPSATDRIPWGSRADAFNRHKWYPLRPGVNDRYLSQIPDWARSLIADHCGDLARHFGYGEA